MLEGNVSLQNNIDNKWNEIGVNIYLKHEEFKIPNFLRILWKCFMDNSFL